jgi:cell division protein ZapA
MKQEVKKYTVTIFGESYTLLGDESELDVVKAASHVDTLMKEIVNTAPHINNYNRAVLTALKLALRIVTLESEREINKQVFKKLIDHIDLETRASDL